MFWTSWLLAALAVALAWPVPVMLAGAAWPARAPFAAMMLWQAIALAGGLSMIGAMLCYGLVPLGPDLASGLHGLTEIVIGQQSLDTLGLLHAFALSAAALLSAHLVFTLWLSYFRIQRQRRRHRDLLHLLSSPSEDRPHTLVISHQAPVAYCLPGGSRSVTVLSEGLLELLSPEELHAVLLHEQTHLTQRHHLLLWAFAAWRSALPWLPTSKLAQQAVSSLIEIMADDVALRSVSKSTLVTAIALVASGSAQLPADTLVASDTPQIDTPATTSARLGRLLSPSPALAPGPQGLVIAGALLLLAIPTALLLVPGLLA
ncbi:MULTISPECIES: M56 family metallopeptidase [Arthrobacter]|uniref:M56 family metallopeptidase n=1 Tax=unclassified Arthrobacter TaxID=235627 RepID=UPI0024BB4BDE|nr:M56 family metallopeptidase [Arthrobacter sp. H35-MC1]MDJ0318122.1 M56 family metallopeptidase [Arthrobacter sp. H35-MC1]